MGKLWVSALPVLLLAGVLAGCTAEDASKGQWIEMAEGPAVARGDLDLDQPEAPQPPVVTATTAPQPEPVPEPDPEPEPQPASAPTSCIKGTVDSSGAVLRQVSTPAATQYSKAGLAYDYQIKASDIVEHGIAMVRDGDCVLPASSQCSWAGVARPSAGTGMQRAILGLVLPLRDKDPDASGYPYATFAYTLWAKTSGGEVYFTPWDTGSNFGKVGYYFHEKENNFQPAVWCDALAVGLL